ncbi:AAA ATPase [Geranomyces michiganensis]|nr:AAA ATPase [Geranomyces michiganensis]
MQTRATRKRPPPAVAAQSLDSACTRTGGDHAENLSVAAMPTPPAKRARRSDSGAEAKAAGNVGQSLKPLGHSIENAAIQSVPLSPAKSQQQQKQQRPGGRAAAKCCALTSTSCTPLAQSPAGQTELTPRAVYAKAKTLFRRSTIPERLVGRDAERAAILDFWREHVLARRPGSIYLSGIPGTGKTALVDEAARMMCDEDANDARGDKNESPALAAKVKVTKVNCMTVKDPEKIYAKLLAELNGQEVPTTNGELAIAELNEIFRGTTPKRAKVFHVVILDEIDTLVTKDCRVLYKLFGWAQPDTTSLLALVGIGNSLDLTMRVLPRLAERNCQPISVKFDPYDIKSIVNIINGRLRSLDPALVTLDENVATRQSLPLMKPMVVELCARKTAATGDLRKALDVCRSAIELAEAELLAKAAKTKTTSTTTITPASTLSSSSSITTNPLDVAIASAHDAPNVTLKHIMAAAASAGAGGESAITKIKPLSLQLKMLLCALVVGKRREGKANAPPTLPALHELYVSIMRKRTRIAPVARTELQDLVTHLESRGLAIVTAQGTRAGAGLGGGGSGRGRGGRREDLRRVRLAVTVDEIEEAVAGEPMLVEFLRGD